MEDLHELQCKLRLGAAICKCPGLVPKADLSVSSGDTRLVGPYVSVWLEVPHLGGNSGSVLLLDLAPKHQTNIHGAPL